MVQGATLKLPCVLAEQRRKCVEDRRARFLSEKRITDTGNGEARISCVRLESDLFIQAHGFAD